MGGTVKVSILMEDIQKGWRGGCSQQCAAARAISRAVGEPCDLGIREGETSSGRRFRIPSNVAAWTLEFDCGRQVVPIDFELEWVER